MRATVPESGSSSPAAIRESVDFADPVRADDAEPRARRHAERDLDEDRGGAVELADAVEREHADLLMSERRPGRAGTGWARSVTHRHGAGGAGDDVTDWSWSSRERGPARIGLDVVVRVPLHVQVLAADRGTARAFGAAEDLVREGEHERVAGPRGQVEPIVDDVWRRELVRPFRVGRLVLARAESAPRSTVSARQRKQGPWSRPRKESSNTVPVLAFETATSAGTLSGTGR